MAKPSLPLPLPHCYWIEPGRILAGEYPGGTSEKATRQRLRRLVEAGVDCFIDLTEPGEMDAYESLLPRLSERGRVSYLRMAIPDHGLPQSIGQMQEILDALERMLADRRCVYLHCRAGIGRTNVVAGCWMACDGDVGEQALTRLNERWRESARSRSWPIVPETPEQAAFVRNWRAPGATHVVQPVDPAAPVAPVVAAPPLGLRDRVRGMLLGLAAGEALGHATHGLPAGAWFANTAMALCLAESFVETGGHDAADEVERYQSWQHQGLWSSTGECVGISEATSRALAAAKWTGIPYSGSHDPAQASAEPLARIGPAVVWHLSDADAAIDAAVSCTRVTHQAPLTLDAVRYFASLLAGALAGADKQTLLAPMFGPTPDYWDEAGLRPRIRNVAEGSWRSRKPRKMVLARHAAATVLETALWAFDQGDDLQQCLESAAGSKGDPSTVAAVVGQLAGAHYGASRLPPAWRDSLARADEIEALADELAGEE
ncbi:MAG: ADP-ribosylglycohydrolase family protein [Steroidobacteraceae bacterium]